MARRARMSLAALARSSPGTRSLASGSHGISGDLRSNATSRALWIRILGAWSVKLTDPSRSLRASRIATTRPERVLRLYFRILITAYDCASLVRYAIWDPCESLKTGYSSDVHTDDLRLPRAHGHVQSISGNTTAGIFARPAPPRCIPPVGCRAVQ